MLKDYLNQVQELYKGRMCVEKFLVEKGTDCSITLTKDLPQDIRKEILESIKVVKPAIKECYKNSLMLTMILPEAEYWEGFSNGIIPVSHAWNKYKGYYIDITWELLKGGVGKEYVGIKIPKGQATKYMMSKRAFFLSPLYQKLNKEFCKK